MREPTYWALLGLLLLAGGSAAQAPSQPTTSYRSSPVDTAHGDREFVLLWPKGAPGALGDAPEDKPKLTVYLAPAVTANGAAAVVCPGGGYQRLASDHEGKQVAEWLNGLGVSAFVLQYRVGPRYHHPAPLQDVQRAIRIVRTRAATYKVDPGRIGVVGFSAGGHLAASAGTHFDDGGFGADDEIDRAGSRPAFMILGYPVISMTAPFTHRGSRQNLLGADPDPRLAELLSNEKQVTAATPPACLFHTTDDETVPVANAVAFYSALHDAGISAELHLFAHGRHGVGLAQTDPVLSRWPGLCAAWLEAGGFLRQTR
jgi:acetyl esterase/lipase